MISEECAHVGMINRARYESGLRNPTGFLSYPVGCECACGHEDMAEWEKMYKVPNPYTKETESK